MPKEARVTKDGGKRTTQVVAKKQISTSGNQSVAAKKSMVTRVKYVAGPANNVYSFG